MARLKGGHECRNGCSGARLEWSGQEVIAAAQIVDAVLELLVAAIASTRSVCLAKKAGN